MNHRRKSEVGWLAGTALVLCFPFSGHGQDSSSTSVPLRQTAITQAEEAKEQKLTPLQPPSGELRFDHIETRIVNPIFNPNGFGLKLGGLPTGGGFSLGPRYIRHDLLREHLTTDTSVVGSSKKWWRVETGLDFTNFANGHLEFTAKASYENAASMPFFGEGPDSSKDAETEFRREYTASGVGALGHMFNNKVVAGYEIGGLLVNVGPGDNNDYPSTNLSYTEATLPGITKQSNFIAGTSSLVLDLTHPNFLTRTGFLFEANDTQFWDRSGNASSFHLLQTQATYALPIWNGMRTIIIRARNETTFHSDGQQVPFYLQPTIGGPNDLRGYERYRFYDNGTSLLSAEYRWPVSSTVELAMFGDGGNVYGRPGLIGLRDLQGDGGFGIRFKNKDATVIRCDVGISPEGAKIWFVFNDAFGKLFRSF